MPGLLCRGFHLLEAGHLVIDFPCTEKLEYRRGGAVVVTRAARGRSSFGVRCPRGGVEPGSDHAAKTTIDSGTSTRRSWSSANLRWQRQRCGNHALG